MRPQLCGLTTLAVVAMCTSGCSLVQPAESRIQYAPIRPMSMEQLREIERSLVMGETSVPTLDPKQLNVGQRVQVMIREVPDDEFPYSVALPAKVAGIVKEVNADQVVLQDVMMVKTGRSQQGVPVVSNVPYFNRLYKNTGVARVSTAIPGALTIEFSSILHAGEVSDVEFDAMQQNSKSQRIGVDFDFDIEDTGQIVDRPATMKQVQ